MTCSTARSTSGSPPRMRGKGTRIRQNLERVGITPAYAGKSYRCLVRSCFPEDHPRVCGEKEDMKKAGLNPIGSPPRMRGKACSACFHLRYLGITPAYAGKSQLDPFRSGLGQDHPRVCGEKCAWFWFRPLNWGSPPRMRGKAEVDITEWPQNRITPAYAGKSQNGDRCMIYLTGSPPRMRGKVGDIWKCGRHCGITPAYAGKRRPNHDKHESGKDHPRVCGEKRKIEVHSAQSKGSPPRMRGKAR